MTNTQLDPTFKVIIVGNSGTGKSSLIHRIVKGFYPDVPISATVFPKKYLKHISLDSKTTLMNIVDTVGQERYRTIAEPLYKTSHAVLFVYDVCNRRSLESISNWNFEVESYCKPEINVLVGTKIDQVDKREVSSKAAEDVARRLEFDYFVEVSSATNVGVDNLFRDLAERLKRKYEEGLIKELLSDSEAVVPKLISSPELNPAFKIITIGQTSSGKTCLIHRYVNNFFPVHVTATIGLEFKIKHQSLNRGTIMLEIWDTQGQEKFNAITENYFRNAHCVLFVYDVCNKESLDEIYTWESQMTKYCDPGLKVMVGTKIDKTLNRQVSPEEGEKLAQIYGCEYFVEVSARTGFGVNNLFLNISEHLMSDYENGKIKGLREDTANITIQESSGESGRRKKCCR